MQDASHRFLPDRNDRASGCLADSEPENRICDAAEAKAKKIDDLFAELIATCKDAAATEPDFHCAFDTLGEMLENCRHDWLTGGVYAEIRLMRDNL